MIASGGCSKEVRLRLSVLTVVVVAVLSLVVSGCGGSSDPVVVR